MGSTGVCVSTEWGYLSLWSQVPSSIGGTQQGLGYPSGRIEVTSPSPPPATTGYDRGGTPLAVSGKRILLFVPVLVFSRLFFVFQGFLPSGMVVCISWIIFWVPMTTAEKVSITTQSHTNISTQTFPIPPARRWKFCPDHSLLSSPSRQVLPREVSFTITLPAGKRRGSPSCMPSASWD